MPQYADDAITANERQFTEAFHALPQKLQDKSASAMAMLSMKLFYPHYPEKRKEEKADIKDMNAEEIYNKETRDPDSYMN